MMQWWRRNALWLVAVVVLVPVGVGGIVWHELSEQLEAAQWRETRIAPGEQIELGGAMLGPASVEEVPTLDGLDQPPGSRIVIVTLPISPGVEPVSCTPPLLLEQQTARAWTVAYAPLGWEGESSCFDATAPLVLRVPYVVPLDAGPFEVELLMPGIGDERLPRFVLE